MYGYVYFSRYGNEFLPICFSISNSVGQRGLWTQPFADATLSTQFLQPGVNIICFSSR